MPDAVQIVEVPSLKTVFANGYARTITERIFGRRAKLDLDAIEGEVLHPDGTSMTFRISSAPVYDHDGGIVAGVAEARDITVHEDLDSASLDSGL
jgi:PAS domain-containing protein